VKTKIAAEIILTPLWNYYYCFGIPFFITLIKTINSGRDVPIAIPNLEYIIEKRRKGLSTNI
jgi:hypothetical protein